MPFLPEVLNPFPALLSFGFFAPLVLRVALGTVFFAQGVSHIGARRRAARDELRRVFSWAGAFVVPLALGEMIVGALLIFGLWTQIAAMLTGLGALKFAFFKQRFSFVSLAPRETLAYLLLAAIALSLLVTGAGAYAIDLPL